MPTSCTKRLGHCRSSVAALTTPWRKPMTTRTSPSTDFSRNDHQTRTAVALAIRSTSFLDVSWPPAVPHHPRCLPFFGGWRLHAVVTPLWRPRPTGIPRARVNPSATTSKRRPSVRSGTMSATLRSETPGLLLPGNSAPQRFRPRTLFQRPSCAASCAVVAKDVEETATPAVANTEGQRRTEAPQQENPKRLRSDSCDTKRGGHFVRTIACSAGESRGWAKRPSLGGESESSLTQTSANRGLVDWALAPCRHPQDADLPRGLPKMELPLQRLSIPRLLNCTPITWTAAGQPSQDCVGDVGMSVFHHLQAVRPTAPICGITCP